LPEFARTLKIKGFAAQRIHECRARHDGLTHFPAHALSHRMKRTLMIAALAAGFSTLALAQAPAPVKGDATRGADKTRMCEGCHGVPGFRTAFPEVYSVPRLGGQHPEYIAKALSEYKSGERSHPSMRSIAASLSDQDMADLAAYYGQSTVTAQK
jgi:cytochrome c553